METSRRQIVASVTVRISGGSSEPRYNCLNVKRLPTIAFQAD